MYPRNAASPEPIAIGAVVQISDGAVQMSGCTVRIMPIGVAEGDGGGTTAYSTDGIVYYTPIQAETNYTSFILVAKKTGCIPVAITVVTTSSATPGTVLLAPVTHTSAVVPTVSTLTGHTAQTGDTYARLGAPAGASVSADIAAVKAETAAIVVDTNELQTDWANGGRLDLILDIIAADTTTDIPALIAALNNISTANVLTQVNAALDTAIAELGVAAPAATPTLRTGLMLLYMALRNKTVVQTSGTDALEIYNNAGTKIASKLLTDDGSDYTEAEMA